MVFFSIERGFKSPGIPRQALKALSSPNPQAFPPHQGRRLRRSWWKPRPGFLQERSSKHEHRDCPQVAIIGSDCHMGPPINGESRTCIKRLTTEALLSFSTLSLCSYILRRYQGVGT